MTNAELIDAYNKALAEGRTADAESLGEQLLNAIFTKIMAEDDYQGRQRRPKVA